MLLIRQDHGRRSNGFGTSVADRADRRCGLPALPGIHGREDHAHGHLAG